VNKQITITGTVFHRTNPIETGAGNQGEGVVTIEVEDSFTKKNGEVVHYKDYFQAASKRKTDVLDIRVGDKVEASLRAKGRIWWKDKNTASYNTKNHKVFSKQGWELLGVLTVPSVFHEYTLEDIKVIKSNNQEEVINHNQTYIDVINQEKEQMLKDNNVEDESELPF
jgi:hypothetical protein